MARTPNCTCKICGKPVYRRPVELLRSNGNAYCSQSCFGVSSQKQVMCPVCGNKFSSQRDRKTCSRACANINRKGVRYKRSVHSSNDKAQDVRALKKVLITNRGAHCQRCGYSDVNIFQVHHIIRRSDGGTNDLNKLELVCSNCHAEIHHYRGKHNKKGSLRG